MAQAIKDMIIATRNSERRRYESFTVAEPEAAQLHTRAYHVTTVRRGGGEFTAEQVPYHDDDHTMVEL